MTRLKKLSSAALLAGLTACGGGDNDAPPMPPIGGPEQRSISAKAALGALANATCNLTSTTSGSVIASGSTDAAGVAMFDGVTTPGPFLVTCFGGTYWDEAARINRPLPEGSTLRSVIPAATEAGAPASVAVTTATDLVATSLLVAQPSGMFSNELIRNALTEVALSLGAPDLDLLAAPETLSEQSPEVQGNDGAALYSLVLAGLAQAAAELDLTPHRLGELLAADVANGNALGAGLESGAGSSTAVPNFIALLDEATVDIVQSVASIQNRDALTERVEQQQEQANIAAETADRPRGEVNPSNPIIIAPTATPPPVATPSPSGTQAPTPSPTGVTPVPTVSPSATPSPTVTPTGTLPPTPAPSVTATLPPTPSPIPTGPTPVPTASPSGTPSPTATVPPGVTPTLPPTPSPTGVTPVPTVSPSGTPSPTATLPPGVTPSPTLQPTPSPAPTGVPTPTATPSATPPPTATPTPPLGESVGAGTAIVRSLAVNETGILSRPPALGSVLIDATRGQFVYRPGVGETGIDRFEVDSLNSLGQLETSSVSLVIENQCIQTAYQEDEQSLGRPYLVRVGTSSVVCNPAVGSATSPGIGAVTLRQDYYRLFGDGQLPSGEAVQEDRQRVSGTNADVSLPVQIIDIDERYLRTTPSTTQITNLMHKALYADRFEIYEAEVGCGACKMRSGMDVLVQKQRVTEEGVPVLDSIDVDATEYHDDSTESQWIERIERRICGALNRPTDEIEENSFSSFTTQTIVNTYSRATGELLSSSDTGLIADSGKPVNVYASTCQQLANRLEIIDTLRTGPNAALQIAPAGPTLPLL